MDDIKIVEKSITRAELIEMAKKWFDDLVKATVDVNRGIMAVGGDLHADEEQLLLKDGSTQNDLWGINLYPEKQSDWIEFDSMINIRPSQNNRSRGVEDESTQEQIKQIVEKLVV